MLAPGFCENVCGKALFQRAWQVQGHREMGSHCHEMPADLWQCDWGVETGRGRELMEEPQEEIPAALPSSLAPLVCPVLTTHWTLHLIGSSY